ncbi:MAG: nucleotidyltransferase domain-containing protein [Candidatus Izemoplasmatales bacterium]|nr:nucleotidyltransferase domain-containing protein [bacterium]MDZ4195622.1 nucleotidyltransferase domain-containing protein [Candidatus Izemoplasmatales bacterium]
MSIKKLRKTLYLTQKEASELVNIPLRTYINYENDESKKETIKYLYIKEKLEEFGLIDEEHGILSINKIKEITSTTFANYDVEYCYLFGSYAKGNATKTSDIDLLVASSLSGLKFYGLVEELRTELKKKVEVLTVASLLNNSSLINEILKVGIKIYG